jgi:molecular chaperone DnaK
VSAKDRGTGKTQAITITASSGLAKDEVERMVAEAQAHADEDRARRDEIEARNRADSLVYQTEKTLQDNKDKLPEADVAAATQALEATRKAIEEGGKDRIESAVAELTRASHRLAEALYKAAPPPSGGGEAAPEPPKSGDDVVDAEVVDDGKK